MVRVASETRDDYSRTYIVQSRLGIRAQGCLLWCWVSEPRDDWMEMDEHQSLVSFGWGRLGTALHDDWFRGAGQAAFGRL